MASDPARLDRWVFEHVLAALARPDRDQVCLHSGRC